LLFKRRVIYEKKNKSFTKGAVTKILVDLTIPMILGMPSMVVFNTVDTYYVGRLGTNQIAAMTFTFPAVVAGLFTVEPLFKMLDADTDTLLYIIEYMRIWYLGVVFVVIPIVVDS